MTATYSMPAEPQPSYGVHLIIRREPESPNYEIRANRRLSDSELSQVLLTASFAGESLQAVRDNANTVLSGLPADLEGLEKILKLLHTPKA